MSARALVRARTFVRARVRARVLVPACACKCARARARVCVCARVLVLVRACARACARACVYTRVRVLLHACACMSARARARVCVVHASVRGRDLEAGQLGGGEGGVATGRVHVREQRPQRRLQVQVVEPAAVVSKISGWMSYFTYSWYVTSVSAMLRTCDRQGVHGVCNEAHSL